MAIHPKKKVLFVDITEVVFRSALFSRSAVNSVSPVYLVAGETSTGGARQRWRNDFAGSSVFIRRR